MSWIEAKRFVCIFRFEIHIKVTECDIHLKGTECYITGTFP